jgi:hypothetical protein
VRYGVGILRYREGEQRQQNQDTRAEYKLVDLALWEKENSAPHCLVPTSEPPTIPNCSQAIIETRGVPASENASCVDKSRIFLFVTFLQRGEPQPLVCWPWRRQAGPVNAAQPISPSRSTAEPLIGTTVALVGTDYTLGPAHAGALVNHSANRRQGFG